MALASVVTNACEAVACEAVSSSGSVHVSTQVELGKIRILVSDDGAGISDEVKARIFTPFTTTKFLGRGLGLASARGIIRTHGCTTVTVLLCGQTPTGF